MSEQIVAPQDLSKEFLFDLYRDAYIDVSRDEDGDIEIQDEYSGFAFPDDRGRDIRIVSFFGAKSKATLAEKHHYVNSVNDSIKLVRAFVLESGGIGFDYYIPVEGGTTKRAIVFATKRFFSCLRTALDQDDNKIFS